MNVDELKRASCYEELELLLTLQGLQGKRKKIFSKLANYQDDLAFCIPTVSGFVWFSKRSLKRIEAPEKVDEDFYCIKCTSLTSLVGAPRKVGRDFGCAYCSSLTSLGGSPQEVGRDFNCSWCSSLTSLEGAPPEVGRDFYCCECSSLTSLKDAPEKVSGSFDCGYCSSLTFLEIERLNKSRSYTIVS